MRTHAFGCACGAVTGTATGEATSVTYCHCSHCRRQSGAPFTVWVGYSDASLVFAGEALATRRTNEAVGRAHCPRCGANLTYRDANLPGRTYIPVGAFRPTEHAYWPERVAWLTVADDLPKRDAVTQVRHASI